jgi:hypothetical protein
MYSRDFFEEHMNFEGHYLSLCRDIPLQRFVSHIRPQPHGLGLNSNVLIVGQKRRWECYEGVHGFRPIV